MILVLSRAMLRFGLVGKGLTMPMHTDRRKVIDSMQMISAAGDGQRWKGPKPCELSLC